MSIKAMKQALEALDSSETEPYSPQYEVEASAMRALRTAIQQAESEPLTDTFVQTVPDKCDRILWRGRYLHLPILNPAPGVPDDVARLVRFMEAAFVPMTPQQDEIAKALALASKALTAAQAQKGGE